MTLQLPLSRTTHKGTVSFSSFLFPSILRTYSRLFFLKTCCKSYYSAQKTSGVLHCLLHNIYTPASLRTPVCSIQSSRILKQTDSFAYSGPLSSVDLNSAGPLTVDFYFFNRYIGKFFGDSQQFEKTYR